MPKPGYTTIVVKESVRRRLQELAEAQGYRSINQLLEAWIGVYPRVNPTNMNREMKRQEMNLKSASFQKGNLKFWSLGRDLNPRPSPYQGDALTGLGHRGTQNIFDQNIII